MRRLIVLIVLAALVVGGWYGVSPWLAMKAIVDAAQAGDQAALEERIDFDQLRARMRDDLAVSRNDGDDNLLGRIGAGIVRGVGGLAIDSMVTPGGLAMLLDGTSLVPAGMRGQDLSWDVERTGLNSFAGVSAWEDGSAGPIMFFERDGISWDLVGVQLRDRD